ncbi:tRNA uracil 4-sulfurtransferase ThiI [Porticoccus sp. W117]|uniref:tRNA uracil 4-sulfurtransferase ThiI n=1 Tax=Porticoccus sp. W117 TaxID=3054777 RepID=UPI0025948167|nr:tRNA uracil 4-sulfurtransferase ThiI [Porticoccus sp. W117]MDM3871458.1 tRNA uracil 4-sulfurtransferase ThiI [Porticoccus sp. W117]
MHFIVKLFPEIIVKSTPVRKRMIKQLANNLTKLVKGLSEELRVVREWDKIEVVGPEGNETLELSVRKVLQNTPGIANFSSVRRYALGDLDQMYQQTLTHWGDALAGKTFCVRAKRTGSHDFNSNEVEQYVGGGLNQNTDAAGVKLKNPDVTVRLEIKDDNFYVIENTQPGLGGFPIGTQDSVISLISGGFDSNVASYLCMKRGLRTHFLFFNLGGRAHELGVKEVAHFLWQKYGASHSVKFITVPFEEVVAEILENVDNSQMGVILKRMMLRAASQVADTLNVEAVVTGEAVAQVSSQTLANLSVIDKVTDTLVLRPLITADKNDIIKTARDIGTEEFSASMPEYCGVISVKPTTRARMERIEREESRFDFAVLDAAVNSRREEMIHDVMEQVDADIDVEVLSVPLAEAVILDIRHPDEEELNPLHVNGARVEKLPFYQLGKKFKQLDGDTRYMLYCAKGIMSRLHAEILFEQGHGNVAVYRPK